jgi:hypothetical protein
MDKLVTEAIEAVEAMCTPDRMSKTDAIDFLEDVVARLESSIEALRDETAEDDK